MYVPIQSNPPSPQAQDLGQRIASTVSTYLAENPGVGSDDVGQAFSVARQHLRSELGGVSQKAAMMVVAGIIGLLFFVLAATLYLGGGPSPRFPMIAIAVAVFAIAAAVLVISRKGL
jgi:hypothetical protein